MCSIYRSTLACAGTSGQYLVNIGCGARIYLQGGGDKGNGRSQKRTQVDAVPPGCGTVDNGNPLRRSWLTLDSIDRPNLRTVGFLEYNQVAQQDCRGSVYAHQPPIGEALDRSLLVFILVIGYWNLVKAFHRLVRPPEARSETVEVSQHPLSHVDASEFPTMTMDYGCGPELIPYQRQTRFLLESSKRSPRFAGLRISE